MPWSDHYDNAGAQILTAWLGALSYAIFGASYLALKLVPMAFGVVLLAMVGHTLARHFSGRAALFGMLSVAVAPPIVTKYSMLAKGNHFEGLTLLFLALLLALEVPERSSPRRRLWILSAGGALGFAISMYFGALLTGVVVALVWWTRFGLFQAVRDLPILAAGLGAGLLPFLAINLATKGRAQNFGVELGSPNVEAPLEGVLAKGRSLIVETLPDAACFEGALGLSAHVAETVFLCLTILAWIIVAFVWLGTFRAADPAAPGTRRAKRAAALVLLAYPIGVLGVLTLNGLRIMPKNPPVEILGVRYLLGYYFFALLLIAVATDRLLRATMIPAKGLGALMMLALLFTWPFTAAIATEHWSRRGDGLGYPGVHLRQYAILFHWDVRAAGGGAIDTTRMRDCLQRLENEGHADQRSELAMGIGSFLCMAGAGYKGEDAQTDVPFEIASILLDFDAKDHPDLLRGVGMYIQAAARGKSLLPRNGKSPLMRRQVDYLLQDEATRPWIAEGFGMGQQYPLMRRLAGEVNRTRNLLHVVPDSLRQNTLQGLATTLAQYRKMGLGRAEGAVEAQIRKLDATDQIVVRELLGRELSGQLPETPDQVVR